MKHLLIILGLLLVGSTTYGQITISNDSILDNDEFIGRYAVWQRFIHYQNERVYVNYILTATLATDQKNEVENAIKIKLDKESQTNTNHTYFFNYALPAQDNKKIVITILTDSVMFNSEFIGRYEVRTLEGRILEVRLFPNIPLKVPQKLQIQGLIISEFRKMDINNFLYDRIQVVTDESRISPTQIGGLRFEEAGKAYNGAAALSIIGAVGGSALVLSGYPLVGSVITLSSGVIAFFVQITGNNKLIKGGKSLQKDK